MIIDESHWGEGKRACRELHLRYQSSARFFGLTATPRNDTRFTLVGRAYDHPTLVAMDVLAGHISEDPVRTSVRWTPARSGVNGDFLRSSAELSWPAARSATAPSCAPPSRAAGASARP